MAELAHQLGYPSTEEQIAARLVDMEQSSEHAAYVAESPEGKIVGWIGGYVLWTVEMDACAVVSGLVVDSNTRSKGVGGVLLEAMEKWADARGCRTIMVLSNTNRARAHRFYERHGYAWIKTEKLFSRPL